MKMKFVRKIKIPIVYLLVLCYTQPPCNGQNNGISDVSNEETALFHKEMSRKRMHLLAHLADRMDLDGEGLRHIKKHMGEAIGESRENKDIQDVADGDNVKGIFYFFKFHDYDNNEKLDGLEWMKALTDFHQEDSGKEDFQAGGALFLDHEAEAIVDELLKKHDTNDDGMIDFIELMNSRVESLMTDLDKQMPDIEGGHPEEGHEQQQNQDSLELEYSRQQEQNQDTSEGENDKEQQANEPQRHSEQLKESPSSEEEYGQQQPQESPSLEEEYNQQQDQDQQQEQNSEQAAEMPSLEEEYNQQQDQDQQNSEQAVEMPSLEEAYNHEQQEQHVVDQQTEQENPQNVEETEGDQSLEQEFNQQQREPSLEEEYNQQQS